MSFRPELYSLAPTYRLAPYGPKKVTTPLFSSAAIDLFWLSKGNTTELEIKRMELVGRRQDIYRECWSLGAPKLISTWRTSCSRVALDNVYKLELGFSGEKLADGVASVRSQAISLTHAVLNHETLRVDVETKCRARGYFFIKLSYRQDC